MTPKQQKIYELLLSGRPCTRQEVFACLDDPYAELSSIRKHISNIRKLLDPPYTVVCLYSRPVCYQLVSLLPGAYCRNT